MSLFAPILHQDSTSVIATLTVTNGSHSGLEVPLHVGYYMIGRHAQCQIRPKSHLVSRRHTLLCRDDSTIQAFDLGSTNGTLVNGQPLESNEFMDLRDGDLLQCGCTEFRVSIKPAAHQSESAGPSPTPAAASAATEGSPIVGGSAWQDFDIVAFLEAEDEAEQQQRYAKPRSRCEEDDNANVLDDDVDHSASPHSVTIIHDTGKAAADCESTGLSARELRIARIRAKIEEQRAKECPEQRKFRVVNRPAPKSNDKKSDALKLSLTVMLACAASLALVNSTYQFMRGASVRVVNDID